MMGNERYTSPALSRQLAEAGLEQKVDGHFYCEDLGLVRLTRTDRKREEWNAEDASSRYSFDDRIRASYYVRALDLTDVLDELTRDREGGPLCVQVRLWHRASGGGWSLWCEAWDDKGESVLTNDFSGVHDEWTSVVEATGLVLLALLRERAKP